MIVYGADDTVARWVSKGVSGEENIFDNYKAIGIVIHSRLIAGIVYHNYHPKAHWDGGDAVSYGMLKPDCRWL